MTCFAPLGLALVVAMQNPAAEHATEVPDLNVVADDAATDEDKNRRIRRDAAEARPRIRDRDRDRDERPQGRNDSDATDSRRHRRDSDPPPKRVTAIIRLKHFPATDAAKTLADWLDLESDATGRRMATVVPVVITNSLMVTGEPPHLEQIGQILRELDRAPAQVQVKTLLVKLSLADGATGIDELGPFKGDISTIVDQLKGKGDVRVLARSELLAGDNQPAFVLVGDRVPRVTGATNTDRGRTKSIRLESVGMILGVTARVADDERISIEIDVERSQLGPEEEGVRLGEDGEGTRVQRIETLTVQTSATMRSGETAVLGGLVYQDERGRGQVAILVQPTIVRP